MRSIGSLLVVFLVVLTACTAPPPKSASLQERVAPPLIGLAMDSLTVERWQRDLDIFVAETRTLGSDVLSLNANNDADEQARQVEYLIQQGIKVLVIVPTDASRAAASTLEARRRGIKVIAYDRLVLKGAVDLYVSFNNTRTGELMAESLTGLDLNGPLLLINGSRSDNNSFQFRAGSMAVIRPWMEQGRTQLLPEVWADRWAVDAAYAATDQVLASGTVPLAIIAANDGLAGGAIQALAERRLAGKVPVVGNDADLLACQRIVEGTQWATIYKPIRELAKAAARAAVGLVEGHTPETSLTIDDGAQRVPHLRIEPVLVTRGNMRTVFAQDNYHRIEDIYRNVKP